ncbi:MAG: hypothetical protein ACREO4_10750 [Lysobacter sp.]
MSSVRISILACALSTMALAGCSNDAASPAPAATPEASPNDSAAEQPTARATAEPDTASADASGSWAYVAGSIYAGAKACGVAQSELDAYKAKARKKSPGAAFEAAFAQGIDTAEQDAGGVAPDARMCELTREALARG